jgi:hypothetical protein
VRRTLSILVAVVATFALAGTALGAITFHSGPTLVWNTPGSATASGNLSGLGNTPATATLQITTTYLYTCQNKGGNVAPGQTGITVSGPPASQQLSTTKNGRADLNVTATAGAPPTTISGTAAGCPNGNWSGIDPVATGPATAHLLITQGGMTLYSATFTYPSTTPNA